MEIKSRLPAFVFCAFIGVMSVLFWILPMQKYSPKEKRILQNPPQFSCDNLLKGNYGKDLEKYLSDHFAGREFFVGLNAYSNLAIGRNGANGVYMGKDGYLINKPAATDNLNLRKNTAKIKKFAKSFCKNANIMIIPTAGFIMDEKLPTLHETYHDCDLIEQINSSSAPEVKHIPVQDAFSQSKNTTQLYYKTDHHLTSAGTYILYREFCKSKGLIPLPECDFSVQKCPNFFGTSYSKSAFWFTPPDTIEIFQKKNSPEFKVTIEDGATKKSASSLFFNEHLNQDDKYPVFLDGNHGLVRITNSQNKNGKLLILKDSFAHCLAPFLAHHYSEIIMADLRYYKTSLSALVSEEHIKDLLVIYGLENFLSDTNINWLK